MGHVVSDDLAVDVTQFQSFGSTMEAGPWESIADKHVNVTFDFCVGTLLNEDENTLDAARLRIISGELIGRSGAIVGVVS